MLLDLPCVARCVCSTEFIGNYTNNKNAPLMKTMLVERNANRGLHVFFWREMFQNLISGMLCVGTYCMKEANATSLHSDPSLSLIWSPVATLQIWKCSMKGWNIKRHSHLYRCIWDNDTCSLTYKSDCIRFLSTTTEGAKPPHGNDANMNANSIHWCRSTFAGRFGRVEKPSDIWAVYCGMNVTLQCVCTFPFSFGFSRPLSLLYTVLVKSFEKYASYTAQEMFLWIFFLTSNCQRLIEFYLLFIYFTTSRFSLIDSTYDLVFLMC